MQTIYYTTANFVRHRGNVVDLEEYRRRLALSQEGSLAPRPRGFDLWEEEPALEEGWEDCNIYSLPPCPPDPAQLRRERQERRALVLDLWASLGVVAMTLAFTLRLLLG